MKFRHKVKYSKGHGSYYVISRSENFATIVPHWARNSLAFTFEVPIMQISLIEQFNSGEGI